MWVRNVSKWEPFNGWLDELLDDLRGRSDVVYTPFDLIGMTYNRARCKRCRGTGRTTRVLVV